MKGLILIRVHEPDSVLFLSGLISSVFFFMCVFIICRLVGINVLSVPFLLLLLFLPYAPSLAPLRGKEREVRRKRWFWR